MISRRKIISKSEDSSSSSSTSSSASSSSDNLYISNDHRLYRMGRKDHHTTISQPVLNDDDGNTWHDFDQLVNDQLEEIRNKWNQIDDEIWAKIICFERNSRVAKAYARSQVLSVTGSDRAFDGYRIGLNGFPNPKRDFQVQFIKQQIRSGFKLKMDDLGNIHIKRVGRCPVFWASINDLKEKADRHHRNLSDNRPAGQMMPLELNKAKMIFDFKKFQHSMWTMFERWPLRPSNKNASLAPKHNWSTLLNECVYCIQLVMDDEPNGQLAHPCWLLLINIVALDLFWSKFKPVRLLNQKTTQLPTLSSSMNNIDTHSARTRFISQTNTNELVKKTQPNRQIPSMANKNNTIYDKHYEQQNINSDLYYCGYMAKTVSNFYQDDPKPIEPLNEQKKDAKRYTPNPNKQLPTFNRIGLEQSKRLFFSTNQLSLCQSNDQLSGKSSTNKSQCSRYNQHRKLNHRMKITYRSTSDLLSP